MLAAGATAVQIDALIWRDPKAAMAIAEAFFPTKDEWPTLMILRTRWRTWPGSFLISCWATG